MRERLGSVGPLLTGWIPVVVAVIVPLAGLLLTLAAAADERSDDARRIGAGTVLGVVVYLFIFL